MALFLYADDNADNLAIQKADPASYYNGGTKMDLRTNYSSYIGTFDVWKCASVSGVKSIDDPGNADASSRRSNYMYFPSLTNSKGYVCHWKTNYLNASTTAMQDLYYRKQGTGPLRANHSYGGILSEFFPAPKNPSFTTYSGGVIKAVNILLGDGHVEWFSGSMAPIYAISGSNYYFGHPDYKDPYPDTTDL